MKLKATIASGFDELYARIKHHVGLIIEKRNPTKKQIEYLATKLDWAGILLFSNAVIGLFNDFWFNMPLFIFVVLLCTMLWVTVLVTKGRDDD